MIIKIYEPVLGMTVENPQLTNKDFSIVPLSK